MNNEVAILVSGAIVAAVTIGFTLIKIFGKVQEPVNINPMLERLIEAVHEQTRMFGEVRDKLMGMGYEQQQLVGAVGRIETSLSAVHRRLDGVTDPRA